MNRTAYNKRRYEYQRKQRETLEAFKREHPDRYAELMKKAQEDIEAERNQPYLKLQSTSTPQVRVSAEVIAQNTARINEILTRIQAGRKDYFIDVEIDHNGWTETHTFFEMLNNPEEALEVVNRNHGLGSNAKVTRVEQCTCPLCK